MNVFDFDGTIYAGDSSVDFWLFCLKKQPRLLRFFPKQMLGAALYALGRISKEEFKSRYFSFCAGISDIDSFVRAFWDKNGSKIRPWYKKLQKDDDCVISASPDFLLKEICGRLGIRNLITTNVDKTTGRLLGKNCHGKHKPEFFRERFGDARIGAFYSDSKSDAPMANMAEQSFFVKREKFSVFSEGHSSFTEKLTKTYIFTYAVLMLVYCCVWKPFPIEEWDDYMMPTVTLASKNPHLAIFDSDMENAVKIYPEWKDYMKDMRFSSLKARNGGELPWYFPTYSVFCIPLRFLLPIFRIPAVYTFAFTNLFILLATVLCVYRALRGSESPSKLFVLILLLTFNPIVFYLEWISAEVFIYSMLVLGMLFCRKERWIKSLFFTSLAATLNPTVLVIVIGIIVFCILKERRFPARAAFVSLISFVPFAYNFYNTGYINLSVGAGFGDMNFAHRFCAYLFDLNYGFLPFFAPILIASVALIPIGIFRKDWSYVYFLGVFFLTVIAYSFMDHINCGMSGVARYNAWAYVLLVFAFFQSAVSDRIFSGVGFATFAVLIPILFSYNPIVSKDADNLHFTPIASFFLNHFPYFYNPLHSTFYSRTAHVYGGYDYSLPVVYSDRNGYARKILLTSNEAESLVMSLVASDEASAKFIKSKIACLDSREQYISVPARYTLKFVSKEDFTK